MSPRAVATWSAAAMATVVLTNNPVYRGLIALVALNFVVARRRPLVSVRGLLAFLGVFAALTIVYNPLISHGGAHRLATIPTAIPGIGGAITLESIVYGVSAAVGVIAAALAVAPLVMVLDPTDILQALPSPLHGTGTALAAALNLVPSVARSFVRVREAESLRGGSARRGPAAIIATLVPVALTTIESSITLAEAMEARAYGSGPRTQYRVSRSGTADRVVMGSAALALAGLLALRLAGTAVDWYPFPAVTLPAVNAVAVVLCMLLAAPLLVGVRQSSAGRVAATA
jgi:energy-coupling factor transport system permease protein